MLKWSASTDTEHGVTNDAQSSCAPTVASEPQGVYVRVPGGGALAPEEVEVAEDGDLARLLEENRYCCPRPKC